MGRWKRAVGRRIGQQRTPWLCVVDAFRRGLDDDYTKVRLLALSKLVEYEGPTEEVVERLVSAIEEGERDLASGAIKLVKEIGEPAAPRLIEALMSDEKDIKLRAAGVLGDFRLGKHRKEVVSSVTALLEDENRDVRIAAISTSGLTAREQKPHPAI